MVGPGSVNPSVSFVRNVWWRDVSRTRQDRTNNVRALYMRVCVSSCTAITPVGAHRLDGTTNTNEQQIVVV